VTDIHWEQRAIALSGLVQALHLVINGAKTGMMSQDLLEQSVRSVFVQSPESITEIYNGTRGIRLGMNVLGEMLSGHRLNEHADLLRYCLSVMALERVLQRRPAVLFELGQGIDQIGERHPQVDDQCLAALANLYQQTISHLEPRIRISGRRNHLENDAVIHRIRALLMGAIRAAVLWHQVGGRRWHLLLARGAMQRALGHLS